MSLRRALIVLVGVLMMVAAQPDEARAQGAGGVTLEDSRSSFTTSTPGSYLRFFARNGSATDHVLRVVSVTLLRPSGRPLAMPISQVVADDSPVVGALTLRPGEGPLVEVSFDDPTGALDREHEEVVYRVRVTIDGVASTLTVRVAHAIRHPIDRR